MVWEGWREQTKDGEVPVGSDYHLWATGTGRGNSVNRAPGELSYGEGLPDGSCPHRAGHHSRKGVGKETPSLRSPGASNGQKPTGVRGKGGL